MLNRLAVIATLALGACSNRSTIQAIDTSAISAVQDDLAHQIGLYLAASRDEPVIFVNKVPTPLHLVPASDLDPRPPANPDELFACGRGDVGFDVTSVKLELTATDTSSYGGSFDATIPVTEVVSLSPSYSGSKEIENSQVLDFDMWPLPYEEQTAMPRPAPKFTLEEAPIAYTLLSLRSALISSAMRYDYSGPKPVQRRWKPCFRTYDKDRIEDGSHDTYALGLKVTRIDKYGLKVSLAGLVNIGANGQKTSTTGNTLTVSFGQTGLKEVAQVNAARSNECAKRPRGAACFHLSQLADKLGRRGEVIDRTTGPSRLNEFDGFGTTTPPQ